MRKILSLLLIMFLLTSCVERKVPSKRIGVIAQRAKVLGNKRPNYKKSVTVVRDTIVVYERDSIFLPDCPDLGKRKVSHWYTDGNLNIQMLNEACDFNLSYTRKFAADLGAKHSGYFNINQACEIFKYCMSKWGYVNDPYGQEYVASASETICSNLRGDCDDFAVLLTSLMMSIGGNARIVLVPGHAYAELDITDIASKNDVIKAIREVNEVNVSKVYTTNDHGRVWLSMDWGEGTHYIGQNYTVPSHDFDLYMYNRSTKSWEWETLRK